MSRTVALPVPQASGSSEVAPSPGRLLAHGEIGFVGLGRMGTAMGANLVAAGHRVIAYVRSPGQMDKLATVGLDPTTVRRRLRSNTVAVGVAGLLLLGSYALAEGQTTFQCDPQYSFHYPGYRGCPGGGYGGWGLPEGGHRGWGWGGSGDYEAHVGGFGGFGGSGAGHGGGGGG